MFLNINIILNSLVFIDLFLTIRNPFYPRKRRMTSYSFIVIAVIVSTIAWVLWSYNTLGDKDEWIFNFLKLLEYIQRYQSIFALILSLAIIVPTGLVMYRLSWRGTSMELKNKVCRRQLIYFFLFLIYLFDVMHEYFLYDVFSDQV